MRGGRLCRLYLDSGRSRRQLKSEPMAGLGRTRVYVGRLKAASERQAVIVAASYRPVGDTVGSNLDSSNLPLT